MAATVTALGAAAAGRVVVGGLLGRGRGRDDVARLLADVTGGRRCPDWPARRPERPTRHRGGREEKLGEAGLQDTSLAVRALLRWPHDPPSPVPATRRRSSDARLR